MRELNFDPVPHEPFIVHRLYNAMQTVWLKSYGTEVAIMALLMCVAWGTAAVRLVQAVRPRAKSASMAAPNSGGLLKSDNALVASIVIASLVFGYNAAVTAIFAEPDFRYRQASDLQAILIAGLGLIAMQPWIGPALRHRVPADIAERWDRAVRWIHCRRRLAAAYRNAACGHRDRHRVCRFGRMDALHSRKHASLTHRPVGTAPAIAKNSGSAAIFLGAIRSRLRLSNRRGLVKTPRGQPRSPIDDLRSPNIAGLCLSAIAPTGIQVRT